MTLHVDLLNAVAIALQCSNYDNHPVCQERKAGLDHMIQSSLRSRCDSADVSAPSNLNGAEFTMSHDILEIRIGQLQRGRGAGVANVEVLVNMVSAARTAAWVVECSSCSTMSARWSTCSRN